MCIWLPTPPTTLNPQQVARDDEYAQHYDTAMRAVEEYAWRGIRDGYSNAWKGADPGFLRALQV